jgi:Rrf2 family protein
MVALGYFKGEEMSSATLADSVNADPTFVRKSLSKLSKAGLVVTKRGKSGASVLARPPRLITLLDIYRASAAPPAFAIHSYPVEKRCPVSCNLKECMAGVLSQAQYSFERSLAKITLASLIRQIREKRSDFF